MLTDWDGMPGQEEKQRLADKAAEELLREEAAEKARKRKSNKKK